MTGADGEAPRAAQVRRALARADRGVSLDLDEATALLHARGDDLDRLCAAAARVRDAGLADAGRSGVVTYSRKVFVPLTRLCRDRCHYCTFATTPARLRAEGAGMFLEPDDVLEIARAGARLGCKEALFTLGDRPEDRWPDARRWLDERGYDDTLSYLRAMAVRVLEETGLLPHLNPGVLSWEELRRLRPVAPSMGLMLETTAVRLWSEPGGPHYGSPDKEPAVRLRVLEEAGRIGVPFTTGILVGIGETPRERVESLLAIRRVAREHGHVQEVIVQNFRAKPDTAMRGDADLPLDEYLATVAVARLLLGPKARVQAPPNLSEPGELAALLASRRRRLGRGEPADPRPREPGAAVAAPGRPVAVDARRRVRAARAAHRPPRVRPTLRHLDRPAGACRMWPPWPARTAWPSRAGSRGGCRGRSPTAGSAAARRWRGSGVVARSPTVTRTALSPRATPGAAPTSTSRSTAAGRTDGPPRRLRRGVRRLGRGPRPGTLHVGIPT